MTKKSSFEDHIKIVESGQEKTASSKVKAEDKSFLDKLADELGLNSTEKIATEEPSITAPAAPKAEGEVQPAASSVAEAAPAVVAATDAVILPQTEIAGGNAAEAAAGEVPATTKPNEGVAVSAGDGVVTDANQLDRTPAAVALAAQNPFTGEVMGEKVAAEADAIGKTIAISFQKHLEKISQDQEYTEALSILKEAELLEGYDIKDMGLIKEAGTPVNYLEKIANKIPLNRSDIIGAACQYVELAKEAEDAEAQGREDAQNLVAIVSDLVKQANETEKKPATTPEVKTASTEEEKIATLLKDVTVVSAIKTLKEKNLL